MSKAVIVVKTKTDLESINTAINQWDQMVYECGRRKVQIVDRILTTAGIKDVKKKVDKLDKVKEFNLLIMYSPHQYADKKQELIDFMAELNNFYGVNVIFIRS
jgi:hypothetical protein